MSANTKRETSKSLSTCHAEQTRARIRKAWNARNTIMRGMCVGVLGNHNTARMQRNSNHVEYIMPPKQKRAATTNNYHCHRHCHCYENTTTRTRDSSTLPSYLHRVHNAALKKKRTAYALVLIHIDMSARSCYHRSSRQQTHCVDMLSIADDTACTQPSR